jgi:Flp pilus assembly protein TadG
MTITDQRGQTLAEFSISFLVFITMLFAIVDFGRAIYQFNGASQAAREIARVTSVHPCDTTQPTCVLGTSPETAQVIATQKALVPNLTIDPVAGITCVNTAGVVHVPCNFATDSVTVSVTAPFSGVTPIIAPFGSWNMHASSSVQIQ